MTQAVVYTSTYFTHTNLENKLVYHNGHTLWNCQIKLQVHFVYGDVGKIVFRTGSTLALTEATQQYSASGLFKQMRCVAA